jgi:hypothetical protein
MGNAPIVLPASLENDAFHSCIVPEESSLAVFRTMASVVI